MPSTYLPLARPFATPLSLFVPSLPVKLTVWRTLVDPFLTTVTTTSAGMSMPNATLPPLAVVTFEMVTPERIGGRSGQPTILTAARPDAVSPLWLVKSPAKNRSPQPKPGSAHQRGGPPRLGWENVVN